MENTNTIQFPNDKAEWFLADGENFKGPFKAEEIYKKLQAKEVTWIDYVYREKEGQWTRLADTATFKVLQAEPPKPKPVIAAPPPPPKKVEDDIKWFLFQNDTQTGPYGTQEIKRLIASAQVNEAAFVWNEKFTEWKPFAEVTELKSTGTPPSAPAQPTRPAAPADKRQAPRKPLVAQTYITDHSKVVSGICRDISVGGMQVLTDQIPGTVGTSIRLNVTPPSDTGLKPFVAEGVIVRVLEDHRGFSFRFTQIADEAIQAIQSYIA
jgi:hypothetical protein